MASNGLDAIEGMAVRRTLLRMTTKDFNSLVVSVLKYLDGTVPAPGLFAERADVRRVGPRICLVGDTEAAGQV